MATKQSSTPSFFSFLKEGLLLPSRNRRLFAVVFALIVGSTSILGSISILLLTEDLAIQTLADEITLDVTALNNTDPTSSNYADVLKEIQDDTRELMINGVAYLLLAVVVGSAVRIVVLFSTVATYSGELHTIGALLGKAKTRLKGPVLTLAFVYVLGSTYIALLAAIAALLFFLTVKQYFVLFLLGALFLLAAFVYFVYFSIFLCSLSVVVAVAEPGCHGAGAVGRAWRLVRGKRWRAVLFVVVTFALAAAVSPLHEFAVRCVPESVATGLFLDLVYAILVGAVELFSVCAITAFYYECKESKEEMATDEYVKVPTEEPNA